MTGKEILTNAIKNLEIPHPALAHFVGVIK